VELIVGRGKDSKQIVIKSVRVVDVCDDEFRPLERGTDYREMGLKLLVP